MTTRGTSHRDRQLDRAMAALGTLPFGAALLVALNCLYIALVAFGNITDFAANQAFVQHVLAMDTTNSGAPPAERRLRRRHPVGGVDRGGARCRRRAVGAGARHVLPVRPRPVDGGPPDARRPLPRGFIVIGGEWFQMWRSTAWNGRCGERER